jgi:hypothetical protein
MQHFNYNNIFINLLIIISCSFYFVVFHRLHVTTFYFSSVYYEVAKRISGIQYVRLTLTSYQYLLLILAGHCMQNVCTFYLFFHVWIKKIIFQILARGVMRNEYYNSTYRVLAWVTLSHLIVSVYQLAQQSIQVSKQIDHPCNALHWLNSIN